MPGFSAMVALALVLSLSWSVTPVIVVVLVILPPFLFLKVGNWPSYAMDFYNDRKFLQNY